ncbi:hypothetical protein [Methylomicrobium sp. Wu6]|uniref:hypothetical protein n=1 Tax=Methylomicrobium sp. Wu6 TaxID=3107928 RepID=UPI002DD6A0C7|nr:hypothetical protein [Methylomicrobium sp. Wu6]MEC4748582.1 hypothetical protein [Methylomicrobium sp. Wu6]
MAIVTIPLGATVKISRQDGSSESYKFLGSDEKGLIFHDSNGQRHADVLNQAYTSITIEP